MLCKVCVRTVCRGVHATGLFRLTGAGCPIIDGEVNFSISRGGTSRSPTTPPSDFQGHLPPDARRYERLWNSCRPLINPSKEQPREGSSARCIRPVKLPIAGLEHGLLITAAFLPIRHRLPARPPPLANFPPDGNASPYRELHGTLEWSAIK